MIDSQTQGKYADLCGFVRHETKAQGGVGAVLLVIEDDADKKGFRAHVAIEVDDRVKAQLPKMLRELAYAMAEDLRMENFVQVMKRLRGVTPPVAGELVPPSYICSPSYTCSRCGATSYNANDIQHGYCGACHDFTRAVKQGHTDVTPLSEFKEQP